MRKVFEFKEQAKQFIGTNETFLAYTKKEKKFTLGEKEEFDYILNIIKIDKSKLMFSKIFKSTKYLMQYFDKLTFEKVKDYYDSINKSNDLKNEVDRLKIGIRGNETKLKYKDEEIHKLKLELENLRLILSNTITNLTEKNINETNKLYTELYNSRYE